MKKFTAFMVTMITVLTLFLPSAFADAKYTGNTKADSILLIDAQSGQVLYSKDPDDKIYPASTTKMMTALLAAEKGDLDKVVTVGSEISGFNGGPNGSSLLGLKRDEKIKFKDLLYGMMVKSGNDAAATIAKTIGGSVDQFVQMMNDKAKSLGMTHTHFVTPHGLSNPEHYTTATDMSKLVTAGLKNDLWRKLITTPQYTMPKTNKNPSKVITTTDKLTSPKDSDKEFNYQYAEGGKTGLTTLNHNNNACLIALAKKDNTELAVLIFGDHSSDYNTRWTIAKNLFDFGFDNFNTVDLKDVLSAITVSKDVQNGGTTSTATFGPDTSNGIFATGSADKIKNITDNESSIKAESQFTKDLSGSIKKGEAVGTITYKLGDGTVVWSGNMVALQDIAGNGEPTSPNAEASAGATASGPVKAQPSASSKLLKSTEISLWWLLLIPVALIIFVVIRILTVNKKRRSRFKNKRKAYNYRIR